MPSTARAWKPSRTTSKPHRCNTVEIIRAADYIEQRWKNDGGVTHEIAADAESPPAWRISVATIEQSGPFSDFRGYDRTIVALEGRVTLTVNGETIPLVELEPIAFAGEAQVACAIEGHLARDFNVMTLRSEFSHDIEIVQAKTRFVVDDDEMVFAYAMAGEATIADGHVKAGETAYLDGLESFDVNPSANGAVCVVRITPR